MYVDTKKLAYGLETGVGDTGNIYAHLPPGVRLRMPICGLVSAAIHTYATAEGIPSQLYVTLPSFSFAAHLSHVVPLLGEGCDHPRKDSFVIDAAPSQFLTYAGLRFDDDQAAQHPALPKEKVLGFALSESHQAVQWLTDAVRRFREVKYTAEPRLMSPAGNFPLAQASIDELHAAYSPIWDPTDFRPWTPPASVLADAEIVCRSIPQGLILL